MRKDQLGLRDLPDLLGPQELLELQAQRARIPPFLGLPDHKVPRATRVTPVRQVRHRLCQVLRDPLDQLAHKVPRVMLERQVLRVRKVIPAQRLQYLAQRVLKVPLAHRELKATPVLQVQPQRFPDQPVLRAPLVRKELLVPRVRRVIRVMMVCQVTTAYPGWAAQVLLLPVLGYRERTTSTRTPEMSTDTAVMLVGSGR